MGLQWPIYIITLLIKLIILWYLVLTLKTNPFTHSMLPSFQLKEWHKSMGNLFAFNYAYKMTKFNVFFQKQTSLVWVSWDFSLAALLVTEMNKK